MNPFVIYYIAGYQKIIVYETYTLDLAIMRFDDTNTFILASNGNIATEVYVSETRAVAFFDNNNATTNSSLKFHVKYCNG